MNSTRLSALKYQQLLMSAVPNITAARQKAFMITDGVDSPSVPAHIVEPTPPIVSNIQPITPARGTIMTSADSNSIISFPSQTVKRDSTSFLEYSIQNHINRSTYDGRKVHRNKVVLRHSEHCKRNDTSKNINQPVSGRHRQSQLSQA